MANFSPNRTLLNPKFEGYRLSPLAESSHVAQYPLPPDSRPTQSNVSGRTKIPLSFEEVQSRITHNHLSCGWSGEEAVFVDGEGRVVRVIVSETLVPETNVIFELPKSIRTPEVVSSEVHKEYPSIVSLRNNIWIASDGLGLLYIFDASQVPGRLLSAKHLPALNGAQEVFSPFKVNAGQLSQDGNAVCVLSSRDMTADASMSTAGSGRTSPRFHLWLVAVPLLPGVSSEPSPLQILWQGLGESIPMYVGLHSSMSAFCILAASRYGEIGRQSPPRYEPSQEELAPIPRTGENLDTNASIATKPPPYSWTQSSDSVTVAFPVPAHVPKTAIKVTLTPKTLTVMITATNTTPIDLPRYVTKPLWDGISPSSSFWTWDKEGEKKFGLLTLHLDKQHEGTKWAHVFATAGAKPASETSDPTDIDVPETLDASELYQIRESLEKYTTALRDGEDASGLGLGSGIPSLAHGEMDAVDANVGRQFVVQWIGLDGTLPGSDAEGLPWTLLSTPLPGSFEPTSALKLVTKSDIDGLLSTEPSALNETSTWIHESTFPALAFVLASKSDLRFTFHVSTEIVLAFESGTGAGGGNLYIYHHPKGNEVWAKQAILRVSGSEKGALLGVCAVKVRGGDSRVLVCLTERELVIVRDLV